MGKSGHGMFLWPKDEHWAAAWTKQVQRTRADFGGHGNSGSVTPTIWADGLFLCITFITINIIVYFNRSGSLKMALDTDRA